MATDHWRTRTPRAVVSRLRDGLRTNGIRGNGAGRPHYIVCGAGSLAYRLVDELIGMHGVDVTVIQRRRPRDDSPDPATIEGVRVVTANRLDENILRAVRVETATALALVDQDDVGNIHAALRAHELNPELRLVIRMFNRSLGEGFSALLGDCTVLSDADIAAPAFVAAALDEVAPSRFRLRGRSLYVTRRTDVNPQDIICGLADLRERGGPVVLPDDESRADAVLAFARGDPRIGTVIAAQRIARSRRRRRPVTVLLRMLRVMVNRKLGVATLAAFAVVVVCGVALGAQQNTGFWGGTYLTLLTTVGGASPEPDANGLVKVLQVALTVAGLALIPLITAAIVDAVVRARLAIAAGRRLTPKQDHLVVVGLGNVGTRVIRQLHELDLEVVAIDRVARPRGVDLAEELKIPLIVGDASQEGTLAEAFVADCRALLVLSTDDVTNLQTALLGRALKPNLRVVLRLFEGDLAERIQQRPYNIAVSRSVSYLAAPEFAAAMMEREVIKTIPVGRHVLLVAEVPVAEGSPLDGATVAAAGGTDVRVIALTQWGEPGAIWNPVPEQRIAAGDRLAVVARRAGLSGLLAKASEPVLLDQPG